MTFQTGRRSIFDVCKNHIGHGIDMLDIQEEGVVKGIRIYCRPCQMSLLVQESDNFAIREAISKNKAIRVGGMSYEQWESEQTDEFFDGYESSEFDELYNDYLNTLVVAPAPEPQGWVDEGGWDTGQSATPQSSPQGRDWQSSQPTIPESQGWEL
jgi:hypothetical protein